MRQIVRLAEHSVDLATLPETPNVLDVGCRGFDFAAAIRAVRPKAHIVCVDPTPEVAEDERRLAYVFFPVALTERDGQAVLCRWHDGVGNFIERTDTPSSFRQMIQAHRCTRASVHTATIRTISSWSGVDQWDLVKLDCEMSEFPILQNWPGPIADQISVEFHDYFNRSYYNEQYFAALFAGPLRHYEAVQHEDFPACDNAMGHWDSLLVLREGNR